MRRFLLHGVGVTARVALLLRDVSGSDFPDSGVSQQRWAGSMPPPPPATPGKGSVSAGSLPSAPPSRGTSSRNKATVLSDKNVRGHLKQILSRRELIDSTGTKTLGTLCVKDLWSACDKEYKREIAARGGLVPFLKENPSLFLVAPKETAIQSGGDPDESELESWLMCYRPQGVKEKDLRSGVMGLQAAVKPSSSPPPAALETLPPPTLIQVPEPVGNLSTKAETKAAFRDKVENMLSPKTIAHLVPTFYVPLQEVLAHMPGYTEEHFFSAFHRIPIVSLVTFAGTTFIRLTGGRVELKLDKADEAASLFSRYRPDPDQLKSLCTGLLDKPPETWVSLDYLLSKAPPESVKYLQDTFPEHKLHSALYFMQMTHRIATVVEGGTDPQERQREGPQPDAEEECLDGEGYEGDEREYDGGVEGHEYRSTGTEGTDNLRKGPQPQGPTQQRVTISLKSWPVKDITHLDTPCPHAVQEFFTVLHMQPMDVPSLTAKLSDKAKDEISQYFSSVEQCVFAHQGMLTLVPPDLIVLAHEHEKYERSKLSLQQQLEHAYQHGSGFKLIRKLQRKIMLQRHPESPLRENDALVEACAAHLPEKGFITQKKFLDDLSQDLSWWLPPFPVHLFKKYPQIVTVFEWKYANQVCFQHAHLSLPPGALRKDFSEPEILRLVAHVLQKRPKSSSAVLQDLPFAVREALRKRKGGLTGLALDYPQYFNVVFRDTITFDGRGAMITLVEMPP